MKKTWLGLSLVAVLALALSLGLARPAYADNCGSDKRVFGGDFVLSDGETLGSNLIVVGGTATVQDGATVACTVIVFGGDLIVAGTVAEDVVVFGGTTSLQGTAQVGGQLVTLGGTVTRAEGVEVAGGESSGFRWDRPFRSNWFPTDRVPFLYPVLGFYQSVFQTFLTAVALGILALLVVLFWPSQTLRVGATVAAAPAASAALGLLTLIAVPVLIVLTAITICLIPVSFAGALLFAAALIFGLIALGSVVGQRLARALKAEHLSPAVSAAIGTGLLWLAMSAVGQVACVGWVPPLLLACLGLGAVVLTRFGTQPYLGGPAAQTVPPAPPAPPLPAPEPS
jgi:hypothetical protein